MFFHGNVARRALLLRHYESLSQHFVPEHHISRYLVYAKHCHGNITYGLYHFAITEQKCTFYVNLALCFNMGLEGVLGLGLYKNATRRNFCNIIDTYAYILIIPLRWTRQNASHRIVDSVNFTKTFLQRSC